ncbi:hypothetical protein V7083_01115, partial [Bacillus sp. JJ1764]
MNQTEMTQNETSQSEQTVPVQEINVEVPAQEKAQPQAEVISEQKSVPIVSEEVEEVTEASKEDYVQENNEQPEEQQAPPRRQRAHLPFNVMMLKQDREKWEFRRRERTERHSAVQTIEQSA